jgi:hypothetical protein
MTDSRTKAFLKNHPKLLAALFGMTMLLSQTAPAVAANGESIGG